MSDGNTGFDEVIQKAKESYDLHLAFTKEVMDVWKKFQADSTMDASRMERVTAQSLLHMAAVFAVDVNMPQQVFIAVCTACYDQAFNNAPKFS